MSNIARHIRRCLARFVRHRGGSVAVYTAVTMLVTVAAVGIGVDTARAFMLKSKLSQALDAAALAGGRAMMTKDSSSEINMFFNANFPSGFMDATLDGPHINQPEDGNTITVSANATMKTIFGGLLGIDNMTVAASAQVTRALSALDVVLSIDLSGSMNDPSTGSSVPKIASVRTAAVQLVDTLFGTDDVSPETTVGGKTYNLLNIGLVPWNSKVNVTDGTLSPTITPETLASSFTNPVTGKSQSVIYKPSNSPVHLLNDPGPDWKGCVYARYVEDKNGVMGATADHDNANDADLTLGYVTLGTTNPKQWLGWEAIPTRAGEPADGSKWNSTNGGTVNGVTWTNKKKVCDQAYWNDSTTNSVPKDLLNRYPTSYPATNGTPNVWYTAQPNISNTSDCAACLVHGITRLQQSKTTMVNQINALLTPAGTTNITQGLFWADQVLMPGDPFNDAVPDPLPFPRRRAIVLLTDGENNGGNGDAYKGVFGAGMNTDTTHHGTLTTESYWPTSNKANTLDNRLLKLAARIKGPDAVRIYVIQYSNNNQNTTNLLKQVASGTDEPFYFNAPTNADLTDAFQKIAADLSNLRLSQ